MASIDWNEYKEFKSHTRKEDRLEILVDFIKSYYNINSPSDMFSMIKDDDIGQMLLERKDINDPEGLESFMFS